MRFLPFAVTLILTLLLVSRPVHGIKTVRVASGLNRPVWVTAPAGDFQRLFILEQRGVVKILNLLTGEVNATPFLDLESTVLGPESGGDERGMQGLVFHPGYGGNGTFFVKYTDGNNNHVISRFSVHPCDPDRADHSSETVVLVEEDGAGIHRGGNIAFGPRDGNLYVAFGDGGPQGDPENRGQDPGTLLAKLLRINVDSLPYSIPPDNPFTGDNDPQDLVRDEIWAFGLRNPYRAVFDSLTGDLYIADVGWTGQEEVDFQAGDSPGGENYGWRCMEGDLCTGLGGCVCFSNDLTDPIFTYDLTGGRCAIIGGSIYRGSAIQNLDGTYFYADWCSSELHSFRFDGQDVTDETDRTAELAPPQGSIGSPIAFAEDGYGEIYIVDRASTNSGEVYKIVPDNIEDVDCNGNFIVDSIEIDVGATPDCNQNGVPDSCEIADGIVMDDNENGVPDECELPFRRGDSNTDGSLDISDPVYTLAYLFGDEPALCLDGQDANDDGSVDVGDVVYTLSFLFTMGPPPLPPFPDCGRDPTADPPGELDCPSPGACI